jgi:long-chain acyl-CoA synthetase
VLRPSIVVGDSRSGWTASFNVLYWPLLAFRRGTYPVLPARRSAPVDVVPVDYVADAVVALAGRPGTVYHLVAGDRASTVGEVVELACEHLDAKRPRLLPPRLYRRTLHQVLLRFGDARRRRRLRRSEQFFPYFDMKVGYDDAEARRALAPHSIEAPPLASYFERLIGYALAAEWGRRPLPRHRAAGGPASGDEHRLSDRGTRLDRGVRRRGARVSSRRRAPR